jgi:hypothetical protein
MRVLRWKRRYETGNADGDARKRAFINCLNVLIDATGHREHCREMEEFIARFSAEAERNLLDRTAERDLGAEFGRRLLASLPLDSYRGAACRRCGLCDLAREKIAENLKAPTDCPFSVS